MSGALRIGCSGWQYRHWRGDFYPADLPLDRWLDFYVRHFDTVELNNSFYRAPHGWRLRGMGPPHPDGIPLRRQGIALSDPRSEAQRARSAAPAAVVSRTPARGASGTKALPASGTVAPQSGTPRGLSGGDPARVAGDRVPRPVLVRPGHPGAASQPRGGTLPARHSRLGSAARACWSAVTCVSTVPIRRTAVAIPTRRWPAGPNAWRPGRARAATAGSISTMTSAGTLRATRCACVACCSSARRR